jgi:hypothetical protein
MLDEVDDNKILRFKLPNRQEKFTLSTIIVAMLKASTQAEIGHFHGVITRD